MKTISDIRMLMEYDINKNNACMVKSLRSCISLVNEINKYVIQSGGKRMRPLLLMLVAKALGYNENEHHKAAAIIEFIHTATLLHDDVVDESELRRGKKTASNIFGNCASILTGDFLYSRAFQMMIKLNNFQIMKVFADATNKIAEGEILQLINSNNLDLNEDGYMDIIYHKTSKLFETSCDIASIISKTDKNTANAMKKYGIHLGNAFQITDDILDYTSNSNIMGKNIGDDLLGGKVTLPLIHTLAHTHEDNRVLISKAIRNKHHEKIKKIIDIVRESGAINYSLEKAKLEADLAMKALSIIPDSDYKKALILLSKFAVERSN